MRVLRPPTIVVYDEHLMCLEGLAAAFDEDPTLAVVATTTSRKDLPNIVEQRRPGICLIDVVRADSACLSLVAELVARAPATAIVLLVPETPATFVRRAVRAGVRGFARKEANLRSLRRTIERVVSGHTVVGADLGRDVTSLAIRHPPRPSTASQLEQLTDREQEVLNRIIAGDDTRHIAAALKISRSTARTHVQNVRRKLGARTKLQAVALALGTSSTSYPAPGFR